MSDEKLETVVYKAKAKEKKSFSFIWILPLIVFCILSWVAYESYSKKGTNITVIFKNADGLKAGVTPLEYKGLVLGKVTKIDMNDLNSVKVNILVNSNVSKYVATEMSKFWIKKPTITLTKITGLGTILSGNKIEIFPRYKTIKELEKAKPKYEFIGLDTKPSYDFDRKGYYVSILSSRADLVEVETPIFYNRFQIGEIVAKEFKNENVYLKAYIYDNYNYLVNKSSQFFMNKALKVNFGAGGMKIELSSLYSAIVGGITVQTPKKDAKKMAGDKFYVLHADLNDVIDKTFINIKLPSAQGIAKNSSIMYKGIEVGKINAIHLRSNDIIAEAYLYKKYEYLLTKNTTFKLEKADISLDGAKNLSNILIGNYLSINYKKGKTSYFFEIGNSIDEKSENLFVTLKSKNLNSITKKSKIYFKNIEIGKVIDYSLSKDYKNVKIQIEIKKQYKNLINNKTLFYDMSSKLLQLKGFDLDINNIGLKPLINGAISFVNIKKGKKFTKKSFKLYASFQDVEEIKREKTKGFYLNTYFDNTFKLKEKQAVTYKNQEIGFIKKINFYETRSKVKIFIYSKYQKYITKKSIFYKKDAIKLDASLSGVVFKVESLMSLINGSIELDNSSKKAQKFIEIFSSKDNMINASNTVSIFFKDVDGLKTQFSKILYKGVEIGRVTNISLDSKNRIQVKVQIFKNFDKFTKKGTIYYLKKPKINLNEIKNVGSTIMPVNIGVLVSNEKVKKRNFVGYNDLENVEKSEKGVILKVVSTHPTSVSVNAPIYYKNVQIGQVKNIKLSFDGAKILIDCLIYNQYKHLIRVDSSFYDISGFKLKFSIFGGTKIETNTLTSILKGGLMVVTPYKYNEIATSKNKFFLNKHLKKGWEDISPSIKIRD